MSYISTLADKAVLTKLKRSLYQPYAYDKKATEQVEQANGVADAGRFNKRLLKGCNALKDCQAEFTALYVYFTSNTLPWLDDGVRMLPNAQYFDFAADMRGRIQRCNDAADALSAKWDQLVSEDMKRLGALANAADYPTAAELRDRFSVELRFYPVPSSNDFRTNVSDEDKHDMERAISEAEANVTKHLMGEMLEPVKRFVEKMAVPIGDNGHIFRDTLVTNLQDVVNRLPRLNINNDPTVAATIDDIRGIVNKYGTNPDVLRESPITREQAHAKMKEIEAKMGAFMRGIG